MLLFGSEVYLETPEMSHADILVCDCDQQQEAGTSYSKYERLKLYRSPSNVPTVVRWVCWRERESQHWLPKDRLNQHKVAYLQ